MPCFDNLHSIPADLPVPTDNGAEEDVLHRQKWTPWAGKTLTGRVLRTIRRGETIYDNAQKGGEPVRAASGSGRFLSRGYGDTRA